jgi:hypothetical protein
MKSDGIPQSCRHSLKKETRSDKKGKKVRRRECRKIVDERPM